MKTMKTMMTLEMAREEDYDAIVREVKRGKFPLPELYQDWKQSFFKGLRMRVQHQKKAAAYHAHTCLTSMEEYGYSVEVWRCKTIQFHLKNFRSEMGNAMDICYALLTVLGENTMAHMENCVRNLLEHIEIWSEEPLTDEDAMTVAEDYMAYVLSFRKGVRA